ncbi:MAG: HAMP domain-containing histidine kinase [Verrucomicrobia bacterium]|nr:HAMP domain-containing histidine kinase [Verrucomicrobiota bacterium]
MLKRLLALHEVQPLPAGLYRQFAVEAERFDMMFALIDFYNQHLRMQNRTANDHWRFLLLRSESAGREYVANFILESDQGTIIIQATESQMRQFLQPVLRNPGLEESAWLRLKSPRGNFSGTEVGADAEALFSIELPDPFLRWRLDVGFPDERHLIRSMRQQTALSIYAGVALLLLIMLAGVLSVRQIRQQMQLNKLQNDFIGMVSHELRTPLASMRMLVETLQEGRYRDPDTLREYLDLIAGENQRLSRLVDSFLSFSRMRRGMSQFQRRQVSPGEAVQLALAATKPHMSAPNVEFGYSIADNVPCIFADPDAIATVLINLLENAYKYSGDRKDIRLQVDCVNDEVRFAVSDNGIGISAKEQKLIFREFYQVDNRLARKAEGSGLGLSINKHIVRAHGGRITVDSTPGQGSTFTVSIPALQT